MISNQTSLIWYDKSMNIKQKIIYHALNDIKGELRTNAVFRTLQDNTSLDKNIFLATNDKGVNKVKRRIRWTFFHLKKRGFLQQAGRGRYIKIGDWTKLISI
jgi:restriction endonuclease Mrr